MRRGRGLRAAMAAVLAFAVLCVAGFGWLLALRTCWRGDRLRLAEAFGDVERGMPWTLSRDGDALVPYYAKFGFVSEGASESAHGGVQWNQMRLTF